jgi:hypothetical protein
MRMNRFLGHFAGLDENDHQAQTTHLQEVIMQCANLGYVMLSQPEEWHFVYSTTTTEIVVFPGVDKVRVSTSSRGSLEPERKINPKVISVALA